MNLRGPRRLALESVTFFDYLLVEHSHRVALKRRLHGKNLPRQNGHGVDVNIFIVRFVQCNLWSHVPVNIGVRKRGYETAPEVINCPPTLDYQCRQSDCRVHLPMSQEKTLWPGRSRKS